MGPSPRGALLVVLAGLTLASPGRTSAQEPDTVRAGQEEAVVDTVRIDPLRNNPVDLTGEDLAADPFENSWPLFGTGARMAIRGYVKLDYVQDFNGAHDRFQFPISGVPVEGDGRPEQSGYMNLFARESRINFEIRKVSERGEPMQIFLEFDFWNLSDTPFFATPRLRHFYAVYGPLLAGRTWGTLTDIYSLPTTLDFAAGDAISGGRRPQIRWEQTLSDEYQAALALEMLEFPEIDNVADQPGQASQRLPMVVARVTKSTERGRVMLGGSVYELRWDGQSEIPNASTVGWGVLFSGRRGFGEQDFLVWNASAGHGWGSNIISGIGAGSGAILTPSGTLDPLFGWNLSVGGAHYFSQVLALNLSVAWASFEDAPGRPQDRLAEGGTAHANVIWSPVKSVNVGLEYITALRRNVSGADGTAHRLQGMFKFIY